MIDHSLSVEADGYWQPWAPKVGDRVRVRLSAECLAHELAADPAVVRQIDGQHGVVLSVSQTARPGHPYWVRIAAPFPAAHPRTGYPGVVTSGVFAATELEPLTESHDGLD